jgi:type I restriction enzyme M protein
VERLAWERGEGFPLLNIKTKGAEQMPNIGGIVKTLQNIMRKDQGVSGDAQRIEQLGWIRIEGHRPEYNFL